MSRSFRLLTCLLLIASATAAFAANEGSKSKKRATKHTVEMKNKRYEPADLTIKVGETVEWENLDDHDHTVVADDKSFKSDNISSGDTYEFTFKKAGKFRYACQYHPRMKGIITVQN